MTYRAASGIPQRYNLTGCLIAMNLTVWLYLWSQHQSGQGADLVRYGVTWQQLSTHQQWWRLVTALFVHFTWSHLLGNMLELWVFGNRVASEFGTRIYLVVFFLGGSVSGLLLVLLRRNAVSYGASLATLCLLGLLVGYFGSFFSNLASSARWKLAILLAYAIASCIPDLLKANTGNIGHPISVLFGLVWGLVLSHSRRKSAISADSNFVSQGL